jgi:hypothetical protein
LTTPARRQQIERVAKQIVTELRAARTARFTTSDETFQRDVIIRVNQILAGDDHPTELLADG